MENEPEQTSDVAEQPSVENSGWTEGSVTLDRQGLPDAQLAGGAPVALFSTGGTGGRMAGATEGELKVKEAEAVAAKRKRGRPPKGVQAKITAAAPPAKVFKKEEEDVCFICFDGGTLVLCDRRDCPKAYHPACVKRDEAFFRGRVRWNCGWHICNSCQRNAHFMCYTCPYSLCKGCAKQADILCVRGNKGFCRTCMTTIMLIENISQGSKESGQVDFDDKSSWEYLFKVYWIYLKQKESLILEELMRATNPWKGSGSDHKDDSSQEMLDTSVDKAAVLRRSTRQLEANGSKRRKIQRQPTTHNKGLQRVDEAVESKVPDLYAVGDWASKELLDFVSHMKNGDISVLSQFDVQALLLEYIRKNNLRDPRRKCQIICDRRLENLFGKTRVGHFEMLKLLEYHFKEDFRANSTIQGAIINHVAGHVEAEGSSEVIQTMNMDKKRQARRKVNERGQQINLDNYAAIDVHNINLIYLKRNLVENLLEDTEKFHDKVVGSIVRIRISCNDQKHDIYRLVRVVGTGMVAEPYKIGNKTTNVKLKILNLNKIEDVTSDVISNQEFSEDECRRLRQSIKCGLGERMTVGEIQEKARALQTVRVKDLLEAEMSRLNHLRDRASEMGHRKEYPLKLELLNTPEERQRRLCEIPEVHADPRMDPSYESDEDTGQSNIKKQDVSTSSAFSNSNTKDMDLITPQRGGDMPVSSKAKAFRSPTSDWEDNKNTCKKFQPGKEESAAGTDERDCESSPTLEGADAVSRILVELRNGVDRSIQTNDHVVMTTPNLPQVSCDTSVPLLTGTAVSSDNGELEKIWHYQDPSGKIQGPFCMLQLHKWSSNGYFPSDLRIWRTNESQDQSILLTVALRNAEYECEDQKGECVVGSTVSEPNEEHCPDNSDQSCAQKEKCCLLKSSLNSGIPNSCPAATCSSFETINLKLSIEFSDMHPQTPMAHKEDMNGESMENGQHATSNIPGQNSGKSWSMSSRRIELPDLPSPTPEQDHNDLRGLAVDNKQFVAENVTVQDLGTDPGISSVVIQFPNLQSPDDDKGQAVEAQQSDVSNVPGQGSSTSWSTLFVGPGSSDNQGMKVMPAVEDKQYAASIIPCRDSVVSWSTASNLVGSVIQLPDIAAAWDDSLRQTEPGSDDVTHSQPDCSRSRWHGMEPIELSTLGDESVSDLLTEVEALESLKAMASPTSRMNCGGDSIDSPGNDCFSPLVGLSPRLDPGKHDAMSSTCDIQFHSHPVMTDGLCGAFPIDVNDPAKMSGGCSSASPEGEGELNPSFVSVQQRELTPPCQPPATTLPLLATSLDSSASPVLEVENRAYVPVEEPELVSHVNSPASSQLPLLPGAVEVVKPSYVPMQQQPKLFSRMHSPASSQSSQPMTTLDSSISPGAVEGKPSHVSLPLPGLISPSHHPPAQLPLEGELKPAYICRRQQDSASENHPPAQPLLPLTNAQPPLPLMNLDSAGSPEEEGELKPQTQQPVSTTSLNSVLTPGEEGELKQASGNQQELVSQSHQPALPLLPSITRDSNPSPVNDGEPKPPYSSGDTGRELVRENVNSSRGGLTSRITNTAKGTGQRNQGIRASQQPRHSSNKVGRHSGSKDRSYHDGVDSRSRPLWTRHASFGGGGGGSSRPSHTPRGQRVCKFYESGYCKKGASCNYLHP
ncbi:hypothetical protein Nepgr_016743 [Nepenthes gracilis]|uniref:Zinc finger CCCH domain-containing protein 44 n=1 Tax=Nepenthes gracilis TaxID=150966 RepID=A0AAD3SPW2_NEPGR|nr:hypothetical protein Nepgr_016743 [Nepenthes gracilis]